MRPIYIVQALAEGPPAWLGRSRREHLADARKAAKPFRDAGEPVRIVYLIR